MLCSFKCQTSQVMLQSIIQFNFLVESISRLRPESLITALTPTLEQSIKTVITQTFWTKVLISSDCQHHQCPTIVFVTVVSLTKTFPINAMMICFWKLKRRMSFSQVIFIMILEPLDRQTLATGEHNAHFIIEIIFIVPQLILLLEMLSFLF